MTVQVKPTTYTKIWASSGSKITPDDFKIGRGWEVEKPPYETMNWVQNRQDQWIAHANQRGIPQWDSNTEYKANTCYVTGATNGRVYRATINNLNINPETDVSGTWLLAFFTQGEADTKFLSKTANLSDLTNAATARTNLNVYSKTESYAKTEVYSKGESDAGYCAKIANLADIASPAAARTNLSVYSQAQVDALFPAGKVEMFAMASLPSTHFPCDGAWKNKADEPRLWAALGGLYGETSTQFRLPDFRGEFLRGWDAGKGVDPGRAMGVWQNHAYEDHQHVVNLQQLNSNSEIGYGRLSTGGQGPEGTIPDINTNVAGKGGETRPRNFPVYYGITR
jgi:hypothetical protein